MIQPFDFGERYAEYASKAPVVEALRLFYPKRPWGDEAYYVEIRQFLIKLYENPPQVTGTAADDLNFQILACLLYIHCEVLVNLVEKRPSTTYRHSDSGFPIRELWEQLSARQSLLAAHRLTEFLQGTSRGIQPRDIERELETVLDSPIFQKFADSINNPARLGSLDRYFDATKTASVWRSNAELAYSALSTLSAVTARGTDRFAMSVLGVLSGIAWAVQTIPKITFISAANATERAATAESAMKAFVPPLGLPIAIWTGMVVVAFAVLITISLAFLWKGYFAPSKSERAAKYIEHFGMLILGAFFGHSVA